jgi:CelD/BcsL family acetyltransferase involved in cellulose biosynthesis
VIQETRAAEDAEKVHQLYLRSFARWGGRPGFVHPVAFYRELAREPAIRFTVARHEGRIIGGTFAVRWNAKVHYLAGYFDPEARSLRPNVLLQIDSIRSAIAGGFLWYDFLPSGGRAAVEQFKEGFGGRRLAFAILERRGRLHRIRDRLRKSGDRGTAESASG